MAQNYVRIGGIFSKTSALPPQNTGLNKYAQARVDNTVSRAVARHANAMRVDGISLHFWLRRNGGLICTCRDPAKPISLEQMSPDATLATNNNDQLRQPMVEQFVVDQDDLEDVRFQVIHMRGKSDIPMPGTNNITNPTPPTPTLNPIEGSEAAEHLDSLAPLSTVIDDISDDELARMYSPGGAVYGGDKTPCGICYSTGRTHGYEYFSGRRLVLDASNEWVFNLIGNSKINYSEHPAKFGVNHDAQSAVGWTVDLPAFTNGWLSFAVRNNLKPANNIILEWYVAGSWQQVTTELLLSNEGSNRAAQQFRVRSSGLAIGETAEFTHVELIYSTATPALGQCAPIPATVNYDLLEPELSVEFEVVGIIDNLSRESVFQDSKYKMLWKVMDVTPKLTVRGQIFGYNITARNVHQGEPLLAMQVLFNPAIVVNYRGLERSEGGITSKYWPESVDVPNDFVLPAEDGDQYNINNS